MVEFKNIEFLGLLVLIIPAIYMIKNSKGDISTIFSSEVLKKIQLEKNSGLGKKTRSILLIVSFVFIVISFVRPVVNNGEIKVKSSFTNMVVAIDMSRSMFASDIYPTRFDFAKKKFIDMLSYLKNTKVSLIGFSSQTFLISPLTQDFHSLEFLTQNLDIQNVNLKGTDILNTLETANELMAKQEKKILFLLTDGSDQKDFTKELAYAKEHHITIYIYGIGTKKGGVIKDANGVLKDKNGNIVVVKLNENIKQLALNSGGAYMHYSLQKDDIAMLLKDIEDKFQATTDGQSTIKDTNEVFYIPLAISVIFLFMALFSLPKSIGGRR